jgi:hypothetical protein
MAMTKEKARELAKKMKESREKYGFPDKKKKKK